MITSQDIKAAAKRMGADIVGIGSIDRWSTAPIQMDPKQIMPKAKSIIALGFRVLRGSLRGVEEGTNFSNYSAMGYGGITYLYMPMTVINLSKLIEDAGYEAVPMGHQSDQRAIDNSGYLKENYSRPVSPGSGDYAARHKDENIKWYLNIDGTTCAFGDKVLTVHFKEKLPKLDVEYYMFDEKTDATIFCLFLQHRFQKHAESAEKRSDATRIS